MKKIIYIIIMFSLVFLLTQKVKAVEIQEPTKSFFQSSSELETILYNSMTRNPSLSYGSSTYNYIDNTFIKNELWKDYGKYYVCLGNGSAYTSHCYISDDPDVFAFYYNFAGEENNPIATYLYATINKSLSSQVYDFSISSGSKSSSSGYKAASSISDSLNIENNASYLRTNVKYFNLVGSQATHYSYNSIKTSDNYYINVNEIMFYLVNKGYKSYKFNSEHKTAEDLKDYNAKTSIEFENQAASYDIYVNKTDNLDKLSFKLNFFDANDYYYYEENSITQPKVYTVMFYGLKNQNGLYNWEMLDDCTNPDFPSEFCDVKAKYEDMYNDEILYNEFGLWGFTFEATIDFLNIFDTYDSIRIVVRLDNAFKGKFDYWDTNNKIDFTNLDLNYFGFDYSRQYNSSQSNRYILFTTKEKNISDNLYITSPSDEIFVDYFNTKLLMFTDYSKLIKRKNWENTYYFRYENIGLDNALGFYLLTDKNREENLIYHFYVKPNLYFSFNNSDTLDDSIFIDENGNISTGDISITPDELIGFKFDNINDLFENIKKFNENISKVTEKIHYVVQYAYDSLNIYIQAFLITIFTIVLVCATIKFIKM